MNTATIDNQMLASLPGTLSHELTAEADWSDLESHVNGDRVECRIVDSVTLTSSDALNVAFVKDAIECACHHRIRNAAKSFKSPKTFSYLHVHLLGDLSVRLDRGRLVVSWRVYVFGTFTPLPTVLESVTGFFGGVPADLKRQLALA